MAKEVLMLKLRHRRQNPHLAAPPRLGDPNPGTTGLEPTTFVAAAKRLTPYLEARVIELPPWTGYLTPSIHPTTYVSPSVGQARWTHAVRHPTAPRPSSSLKDTRRPGTSKGGVPKGSPSPSTYLLNHPSIPPSNRQHATYLPSPH